MSQPCGVTFLTLDLDRLRACLPLDHDVLTLPPKQSLGALSVLPNELLFEILVSVDIPTLTSFRRVNRTARATVDGIPLYASLVRSHGDVLRAVVAAKATAYTCHDLSTELQKTQCRKCNSEATHLYLITCQVVCRRCFTGCWVRDAPPDDLSPSSRAKYRAEYPFRSLVQESVLSPVRGMLRDLEDYVPLTEAHVLEHCEDIINKKELRAVIPHILSLPAWSRKGGKQVCGGRRVRLYDTRALLERYKVDECYCMRNVPDVMRRYQAVVALREETEEEREGDVPRGVARDPFEPCWRAVHMN